MLTLFEGGNLTLLLVVAAVAVGGFLVERLFLVRGWAPYFRLGMPLGEELLPIPTAPTEGGRTATVRYAVDTETQEVRFWARPGDRAAPMGLHGVIGLVRGPRGIHLPVRWSPPFTPFAALIWFAGLGAVRGVGHLTIPVAVVLMAILLVMYRQAAVRAARELRWSFVAGRDGASGSE